MSKIQPNQNPRTSTNPLRIGVLASGSGTNLQSIIDHCSHGNIDAKICIVISNVGDAGALKRAQEAKIPTAFISHQDFKTRKEFDGKLVETLQEHNVELVVLAGFMRLVSSTLLRAFPMQVLNIHPALLPAFPGLQAQSQALMSGARFTGVSVHFVDEGTDTGPIFLQATISILPDESVETLTARLLKIEHQIYPAAIGLIAQGRVTVSGRNVRIEGQENHAPDTVIFNPPLGNE